MEISFCCYNLSKFWRRFNCNGGISCKSQIIELHMELLLFSQILHFLDFISFNNVLYRFNCLYGLYMLLICISAPKTIIHFEWYVVLCFSFSFFLSLFFNRPLVSLRLSSIKNVLMITWKCLMEKRKNRQFLDDYVATKFQSPSWLLEIKCLFVLFLMHLFKGKAFKPHIPQVSKHGHMSLFWLRPRYLFRWMQWILWKDHKWVSKRSTEALWEIFQNTWEQATSYWHIFVVAQKEIRVWSDSCFMHHDRVELSLFA